MLCRGGTVFFIHSQLSPVSDDARVEMTSAPAAPAPLRYSHHVFEPALLDLRLFQLDLGEQVGGLAAGDDRILECAVEAQADSIISGDAHLLELGDYRGIPIMSPSDFLKCT
ncbi:MAG: hypothetical protein IIA65_09405 [Planctomycetes bacterium]|nr:hypothetical protein [Planctomycetota bacterium]